MKALQVLQQYRCFGVLVWFRLRILVILNIGGQNLVGPFLYADAGWAGRVP